MAMVPTVAVYLLIPHGMCGYTPCIVFPRGMCGNVPRVVSPRGTCVNAPCVVSPRWTCGNAPRVVSPFGTYGNAPRFILPDNSWTFTKDLQGIWLIVVACIPYINPILPRPRRPPKPR